jgi:hypothetical protein
MILLIVFAYIKPDLSPPPPEIITIVVEILWIVEAFAVGNACVTVSIKEMLRPLAQLARYTCACALLAQYMTGNFGSTGHLVSMGWILFSNLLAMACIATLIHCIAVVRFLFDF